MTFTEYLDYFKDILENPTKYPVYADQSYLDYTKLNWSRMNRWLKKFVVSEELKECLLSIEETQTWIVITEPWCGDAAHSVPQIVKLAELNSAIRLDIQLRDTAPFLIDKYLTNGGKSIPKLIVRNDSGEDVFVWGPRPEALQHVFDEMKKQQASFDDIKEELQHWYNADKGVELQKELLGIAKLCKQS